MKNKSTHQNRITVLRGGLIFLFILNGLWTKAQDNIILKNGEEIDCKVTEVSDRTIKYSRPKENEPFLRVVPVAEVFMIRFENGRKEVFDRPAAPPSQAEVAAQPAEAGFAPGQASFGGPRIGVTFISAGSMQDFLISRGKHPVVTQFGWQFEKRLFSFENGPSGIFECLPFVGGMEQGLFLPSLSTLIGVRGSGINSPEFAVGPTLSRTGLSMVFAFGINIKYRSVNFPVNIAYVPSIRSVRQNYDYNTNQITTVQTETGHRISLMIGFNVRKH